MRFQEFRSTWPFIEKQTKQHGFALPWKNAKEMLNAVCRDDSMLQHDPIGYLHNCIEFYLERAGRPYYDLYPGIIPPLLNLKLDLGCELVQPPREDLSAFSIRFAEGNRFVERALSIGVAFLPGERLTIGIDTGGTINAADPLSAGFDLEYPAVSIISFELLPGKTIEEQLNKPIDLTGRGKASTDNKDLSNARALGMNRLEEAVRIVVSVCLIGTGDEMLVAPEILNKDKDKWKGASDEEKQRLIDKAKRRGKFGFSLGKELEVVPHYRRGHPALVWTGTGRKIPKVVWRRGSLVHREKVEKVPTGYEGK